MRYVDRLLPSLVFARAEILGEANGTSVEQENAEADDKLGGFVVKPGDNLDERPVLGEGQVAHRKDAQGENVHAPQGREYGKEPQGVAGFLLDGTIELGVFRLATSDDASQR